MAHEKLSPRQKMIGMMYLVLTAMLALNVSKDAVKAFMKVEQGLTKTVNNYALKNKDIYDKFEMAARTNRAKSGPFRDKAFEVKQAADELFTYIQGLKIEIIKTRDGEETTAVKGQDIDIFAVKGYDDNNVPSQILIGSNESGKGFALRAAINDYREFLISKLEGKNMTIENALRSSLNTEDGKDTSGKIEPWPNNTFQPLPLVAVVAMLTKIQVDVRNAETDVLTFLYDQIDARSFKFTNIEATVLTNSTYIMQGQDYEASVFITASDTLQAPVIALGNYKSTPNADGTVDYEMVGDYTTLPIDETGKGIYKVRATSVGQKSWGGLITMNAPDGTSKSYPFKSSYSVGLQNVVVSPTAMNVLYQSIENPIDVSVPGIGSDKIRVTMKNGSIEKGKVKNSKGEFFPGEWKAIPQVAGQLAQVFVSYDANGKQMTFQPYDFRVRTIPDPVAKFAGKSTGTIDKNIAMAQQALFAVLENFDFDLKYDITEFTITISDKGFDYEKISKSNIITGEQKDLINRLTRNKNLTIVGIKAIGPDKRPRELPAVVLKIQ
jgi:gliding motility-associated protein GldM